MRMNCRSRPTCSSSFSVVSLRVPALDGLGDDARDLVPVVAHDVGRGIRHPLVDLGGELVVRREPGAHLHDRGAEALAQLAAGIGERRVERVLDARPHLARELAHPGALEEVDLAAARAGRSSAGRAGGRSRGRRGSGRSSRASDGRDPRAPRARTRAPPCAPARRRTAPRSRASTAATARRPARRSPPGGLRASASRLLEQGVDGGALLVGGDELVRPCARWPAPTRARRCAVARASR